jgi:serine/threonine-protein kinase
MRATILAALLMAHAVLAIAQTPPPQREHAHFPPGAIWYQNISAVTPDVDSSAMTTASVGWGTGSTSFQLDFSMHLLYASWAGYTNKALAENAGYFLPDCETGYPFPVPAIGAVEGVADYTSCDYAGGDDCHLSVVLGNTLYESYQTGVDSNGLHSTCMIRWHLNLVYPPEGRGDGCTSADAAGFPIGTMLFTPDDVYAATQVANGDLGHSLRFALPNPRMRAGSYVHPGSHYGAPTGPANAIPYGARLRLKTTFAGGKTVNTFSSDEAVRVILRTLQNYGMFLSDGGSVPLIADDGMFSTKSWSELGIDSHALFGIALADFDVLPIGTVYTSQDCAANGFGDDVIFSDGYNW